MIEKYGRLQGKKPSNASVDVRRERTNSKLDKNPKLISQKSAHLYGSSESETAVYSNANNAREDEANGNFKISVICSQSSIE